MKIAIVVPSNIPIAECQILRDGSITEMGKLGATLQFVGQGAFFNGMPYYTGSPPGFQICNCEEPETTPARMAWLRQVGAYKQKDADYYIMADANIEFVNGSADMLQQCIDFLERERNFGAVACTGSFGGNASGKEIVYYKAGKIISTARGIVIRNDFYGRLFEEDQLECAGGLEEHLMCIFLNRRGLSIAKQFYHPTKHHDLWKTHKPDEPRHNQIHDLKVSAAAGAIKWIRENVKPDYTFGDKIINLDYDDNGRPVLPQLKSAQSNLARPCTVNGISYPSVQRAFQSIGLPLRQCKNFQTSLRANGGRQTLTHNGVNYVFVDLSKV
jgi:hypothetical protein